MTQASKHPPKHVESWGLYFAHDAGRAARQVTSAADRVARGCAQVLSSLRARAARGSVARQGVLPAVRRVDGAVAQLGRSVQGALESLSRRESFRVVVDVGGLGLEWPDIESIARASGLTAALDDMQRVAGEYDDDPVVRKLARNLEAMSPEQLRQLLQQVIEPLLSDSVVQQQLQHRVTYAGSPHLRPDDIERLASAFVEGGRRALDRLDINDAEARHLAMAFADLSEPLSELARLYLNPRGALQHMQRYWRIQRVSWNVVRIMMRPRPAGLHRGYSAAGPRQLDSGAP